MITEQFAKQALAALQPVVVEHARTNELWTRVDAGHWQRAARICRDELRCEYFSFLSAVDWLPNPDLNGEKTFSGIAVDVTAEPPAVVVDPLIRKAGGTSRFQVIAHVYNVVAKCGLTLTADVDDQSPSIDTWTGVYKGADWHERETWEMFGIDFAGHPGLRHMYLPAEFEGYPMRKDFALLAREVRPWPGLVDMEEMPTPQLEEMPTPQLEEMPTPQLEDGSP